MWLWSLCTLLLPFCEPEPSFAPVAFALERVFAQLLASAQVPSISKTDYQNFSTALLGSTALLQCQSRGRWLEEFGLSAVLHSMCLFNRCLLPHRAGNLQKTLCVAHDMCRLSYIIIIYIYIHYIWHEKRWFGKRGHGVNCLRWGQRHTGGGGWRFHLDFSEQQWLGHKVLPSQVCRIAWARNDRLRSPFKFLPRKVRILSVRNLVHINRLKIHHIISYHIISYHIISYPPLNAKSVTYLKFKR